jgi:hypothetical protein
MKRATPETTCEITSEGGEYCPAGLGIFSTKADAMEAAARAGYRYAYGAGTYWPENKEPRAIPEYIRARARKG